MENYSCIAIDMGASAIRMLLGTLNNSRLDTKEIYRIENKMFKAGGYLRWDMKNILQGIKKGIQKASDVSEYPVESIGVDSWGVDFSHLDKNGELLEFPVSYRDERTRGMPELWEHMMSLTETFQKTGINFNIFNSLYQLLYLKDSDLIKNTHRILFMAEYINYCLSGKDINELTISSTSQMLNFSTLQWDESIIRLLKLENLRWQKPVSHGKILGNIQNEFTKKDIKVVLTPAHDTAAALLSVPSQNDNYAFLSTGTWCIIGTESEAPFISDYALKQGITNEIAANGGFRSLKNLPGLWFIQKLRESIDPDMSYEEIDEMAVKTYPSPYLIDTEDPVFYNPENMKTEFDNYILKKYHKKPQSEGEYFRCAYDSLAASFRKTLLVLQELRGKSFYCVHMIGGGCQSEMLCQCTANVLKLPVYSGPVEAAATGNIISQILAMNKIPRIEHGKKLVEDSFNIKLYLPEN